MLRLINDAAAEIARDIYIGVDAGDAGAVDVIGSMLAAGERIYVGFAGDGRLFLDEAASVSAASVGVGFMPGGFGEVTIVGPESILAADHLVEIGVDGHGSVHLFDDGMLSAVEDIFIGQRGSLRGTGFTEGHLINEGNLAPEGALTLLGDLDQMATGEVQITLGSDGADVLDVHGVAHLAGILRVQLADGFVPQAGTHYDVILADEVIGSFDALRAQPLPNGFSLVARYHNDRVRLTVIDGSPSPGEAGLTSSPPGSAP